jgi:hypothetical protein
LVSFLRFIQSLPAKLFGFHTFLYFIFLHNAIDFVRNWILINQKFIHLASPKSTVMNLFDRAKNIIITPNKEWDVISTETPDTGKIITGYVLPLAGLAALAAFIGYGFIGINLLGLRYLGINWGIYYAISILINALVSVFVCSFVIDALAPSFGSEKNMGRSMQLVAYSYTPFWVGGLLAILPALAWVGGLFGIYGLYLLYIGMPKLKKTPADKLIGYFIVSLLVIIAVYFVIGLILGSLLWGAMGLTYRI